MLIVPNIPFIPKRKKTMKAAAVGPVLLQATYVSPSKLTLVFDRAIDVSAIDVGAFTTQTPQMSGSEFAWAGVGVNTFGPQSVTIDLQKTGPATGTQDRFSASPSNGIVASDDGVAWTGVIDQSLPFG